MATCTFFGHRTVSKSIQPLLKKAIEDLILESNVDVFYVGNQGEFDKLVRKNLQQLKVVYPQIKCYVVHAYIPQKSEENEFGDNIDTIYPEGLEKSPLRYAIINRNKWMIEKSNYVITHVTHISNGAYIFKELCLKKGKSVINII